jgi:hypothetical protein
MSKPAAGTYYIVNRVTSPTGEDLAITFNGQGNVATVTPLTRADSQKVIPFVPCQVGCVSYSLSSAVEVREF